MVLILSKATQRLLPCFGHASPPVWTLNYPAHCKIKSTQITWITPWLSLPRSNPCSILLDFHCDLADSSQLQGKIKSISFSTLSPSTSCSARHRASCWQDELPSNWPPPKQPRAVWSLNFRAAGAGAAMICLTVPRAQEQSLGSV